MHVIHLVSTQHIANIGHRHAFIGYNFKAVQSVIFFCNNLHVTQKGNKSSYNFLDITKVLARPDFVYVKIQGKRHTYMHLF